MFTHGGYACSLQANPHRRRSLSKHGLSNEFTVFLLAARGADGRASPAVGGVPRASSTLTANVEYARI